MTAADLDADWAKIEFRETVTVRIYNPATDTAPASPLRECDAYSAKHERNEIDLGDDIAVFQPKRVWNLRASQLPSLTVTIRSLIIDPQGRTYAVDSVELLTMGTRWRCVCHAVS